MADHVPFLMSSLPRAQSPPSKVPLALPLENGPQRPWAVCLDAMWWSLNDTTGYENAVLDRQTCPVTRGSSSHTDTLLAINLSFIRSSKKAPRLSQLTRGGS